MVMEMLHNLFPAIGGREYRTIILVQGRDGLPKGEYGFVEAYCTERGCDCRNVLLNVMTVRPPRHLTTINYALDPDGFADLGIEQSFLDPANPQSELSPAVLRLFRSTLAHDAVFLKRLDRHLAMVKALPDGRKTPPATTV